MTVHINNSFRNQQDEVQCTTTNNNKGCCGGDDEFGTKSNIATPFDNTEIDLAKEMNELSVQEREKVYDELHGVAKTAQETPELIAACIQNLDAAILKIPKPKRRLLDRAYFLRPSLQVDDKFKLMFLRGDLYDATKAAKRMVKFFQVKHDIFGNDDMLVKDITLDDLDPKDIEAAVLSGCCLILPQKDQTGRPILFYDVSKFDHYKPDEFLRFTWYITVTTLSEDDVAQTKGFTNLTYAPVKRSKPVPFQKATQNMISSGNMVSSIPVRVTGYHYITDDPAMTFTLKLIRMTYGKQVRLRTRTHFGSELEMEYSLLTFGIQCKALLDCGEGKTSLHDEYLQRRREIEAKREQERKETEQRTGIVLYPKPNDVLIGRGRPYHEFTGTRKLIEMIDQGLDRYYGLASTGGDKDNASSEDNRFQKTCMNIEMVKKIQESNGRFLQRKKNIGWMILDDTTAREKTANLFRYRYNMLGKQQQQNSTKTTTTTTTTTVTTMMQQRQQNNHNNNNTNTTTSNMMMGLYSNSNFLYPTTTTTTNNNNNNGNKAASSDDWEAFTNIGGTKRLRDDDNDIIGGGSLFYVQTPNKFPLIR